MNFFLPYEKHKWFNHSKCFCCACGRTDFVMIEGKKWCVVKLNIKLNEQGYVLAKKDVAKEIRKEIGLPDNDKRNDLKKKLLTAGEAFIRKF